MIDILEVTDFVDRHANLTQSRTVVYSVLFEEHDRPPILPPVEGIDCFLFTDRPNIAPACWQAIFIDPETFGAQRTGRYFKCLGHRLFPEVSQSVYFDASFRLLRPINRLLSDHKDARFALFRHAQRDDIEAEAEACRLMRKGDHSIMNAQIQRYREQGLPSPSLCYATGVLIRKLDDPTVKAVNEAWCAEILAGSVRDQISLPYVLWRADFQPDIIEGDVFYNRYLIPLPHLKSPLSMRWKRFVAIWLYQLGILRR